jgi:hypothetical protein
MRQPQRAVMSDFPIDGPVSGAYSLAEAMGQGRRWLGKIR